MNTYNVTNIQWDTDGEDVYLPSCVRVEAEEADHAVDVASDMYGFCIFNANVEEAH